jgi:DnaK suppressor protein
VADELTRFVDEAEGLLDQVDRALGALGAGTYGICEACGEPIDPAILASEPLAVRCPTCAGPAAPVVADDTSTPGARSTAS